MEKVAKLPAPKAKRIRKAAMLEFAKHGYAQASTNQICKEAGISKGLLFHYFKSKKQLYFSLIDYAIAYVGEYVKQNLGVPSRDLFALMRQAGQTKLRLYYEDPVLYDFLVSVWSERNQEVAPEIAEHLQTSQIALSFFREIDIDWTPFREELERSRLLELIILAFEAWGKQYLERYRQAGNKEEVFKELFAGIDVFVDILKHGVYKPELQKRPCVP